MRGVLLAADYLPDCQDQMIRDLILGHISHGSTLESFLSESIVHRAKDQQRNMGMVLV